MFKLGVSHTGTPVELDFHLNSQISKQHLGFGGSFLPPLSLAERLGRGVGGDLVLVGVVLADVDGDR